MLVSSSGAMKPCASVAQACVDLGALRPSAGLPEFVATGHRLMAGVVGADEGHVVVVTRVPAAESDPLHGFRAAYAFLVGTRRAADPAMTERFLRSPELVAADPTVRAIMAEHGHHRVYHAPDPRTDPAQAGTIDLAIWTRLELVDRLKAVHALDADRELHLAFDRFAGDARPGWAKPFDENDVLRAHEMIAVVGPWVRRLFLLAGLLPGHDPLAPREQEMLALLLGGAAQKTLHTALGVSVPRARELVRDVYAKLGVSSRSELHDLWLGPMATQPVPVAPLRKNTAAARRSVTRRAARPSL